MASPPPLQVDIVDQRIVQLTGQKAFTSYCIRVTYGDSTWCVYYSEDQINRLARELLQPVIEGYLYKKAENWLAPKQWNKRYFKFLGNTLYYSDEMSMEPNIFSSVYKKIEIKGAKITPTYDMEKVVSDAKIPNDIVVMKGMFEIHLANNKIVYLRAPSQGDMIRWVDALKGEKEENNRRLVRSAPIVVNTPEPFRTPRGGMTRSDDQHFPSTPPEPITSPRKAGGSFWKAFDEPTPITFSPSSPVGSPIGSPISTPPASPPASPRSTPRRIHDAPSSSSSSRFSFSSSSRATNALNNINAFLKNLCNLHQGSDILRSFLLVHCYTGEEFPQHKLMLDAFDSGDLTLIKKLHGECGVPIIFTYDGKHSFTEACRLGRFRVVEYMFATEPESSTEHLLYKTDHFEQTGLHYACFSSFELALFLINRSSVDKLVSMFGTWTPLHHIAKAAKVIQSDQVEIVRGMVLALKKHIDAVDMVENYTPLHICAKECNTTIALILLQNGANYEILTHHGKTFLHLLVHNTSTKSHDMTAQVLQYLFGSVNSLRACSKQLEFLEIYDNDARSAITCALNKDPNSPHVSLLMKHYEALENFKFKFIINEIMFIYSQPSSVNINVLNTSLFQNLCELISSACSINEYHHDIAFLISRFQELYSRTEKCLRDVKIAEKQKTDFMDELQRKTYPFVFSLFLKKKAAVDFIMDQYIEIYQTTMTRMGMGITDEFWQRTMAREAKSQIQLGMQRDVSESAFVKRALGLLSAIPHYEKAHAKINCIREILHIFQCKGDEEFSLLSYLMVRAHQFNIHWSAEIDYIQTFLQVDKYSMLLKSIQMFFLTSWVRKINEPKLTKEEEEFPLDDVIADLRVMVDFSKTIPSGATDSLLLLAVFFFLSQDAKQVSLEGIFSRSFLSHAHMFQITTRLQLTIRESDNGIIVYCGDDITSSVFARLTTSFFGMLSQEDG